MRSKVPSACFQEVAADKAHGLAIEAEPTRIEPGKLQGVFGDVHQQDFGRGPGFGKRETDAAGGRCRHPGPGSGASLLGTIFSTSRFTRCSVSGRGMRARWSQMNSLS